MRGTESEVAGMISATSSMKTVKESRTVMPSGDRQSGEKRERSLVLFVQRLFFSLVLTVLKRRLAGSASEPPV